jgi:disulfide bond formation protein DsbB
MKPLTTPVVDLLGALALVSQVLLGVVILIFASAFVFPPAAKLRDWLRVSLGGTELYLAFIVALLATCGSLFFSEYAGFIPCRLCWLQRIWMYPLVPLLLALAIRRDTRGALFYALPLPILGICFSLYHLYIEANPSIESQGCKIGGTSCATKWINEMNYITIPLLALTAFLMIITLILLAAKPLKNNQK